ncbi:MAG TPA: hypothetical protein VK708_10275, partial [Bryobacteraceae bacterium]|nr:hypothetical protein [Bryobacteraceae bacterium]
MEISRGSLAIALTLSLLILCSGCAATQQIRATIQDQLREMRGLMAQPGERDGPPAGILPGTHLVTIHARYSRGARCNEACGRSAV